MPSAIHDQLTIAAEQLDTAIELFLAEHSDASALTLAGAAEEILGRALEEDGGVNALQQAYEAGALTHRLLCRKDLGLREFAAGENYPRNAAKHLFSDRTMETDLRRAAMWMIVRACANHDRLGRERTDRMRAFDVWFHEHEVGA